MTPPPRTQVLRFCAFFQERVPDSPEERWRVRRCHLLHYLEDGSTQVEEPHEDNSGLRQGTLLRRHRCVARIRFAGARVPLCKVQR